MRSSAITLSLCVAVVLSGCSTAPSRGDVGAALLFDSKGTLDTASFNAALRARLPPGTPLEQVNTFFASLGAVCASNAQYILYSCTIPLEKPHCGSVVNVRIDSENRRLTNLDSSYGVEWCD